MVIYLKQMFAGMVSAVLCVVCGILLHSCADESAYAAPVQSAEVMSLEAQYEGMTDEERMEGVVYE